MTTALDARRTPALHRDTAMRLAETEYDRAVDLLTSLAPDDWAKPTDCPAWDVRQIAAHMLGMVEMSASFKETVHQMKTAQARGGVFVDALTDVQVSERAHLEAKELIGRYVDTAPRAVRGRLRMPGFVRKQAMPGTQVINGVGEKWTIGFLNDVILTRDAWMHRVDIARATSTPMELTAEHDGVLVDDVVREWMQRHGQPVTLRLTGPAGGTWGSGGPDLELDAVEFCRGLAGRGTAALGTAVPF